MNAYRFWQRMTTLALGAVACASVHAAPLACQSLTPVAIQNTISRMNASLAQANIDFGKNGVNGAYAVAAKYNRDYIVLARDLIVSLQTWLKNMGLDSPYVTNASAAYNVYGYIRDSVPHLHHARHWAAISAVYHSSKAARQSIELTTQALNLLEPLSAQATRCYVDQYGPFTQ
jgi:hypothetical protein